MAFEKFIRVQAYFNDYIPSEKLPEILPLIISKKTRNEVDSNLVH